MPTTLNSMLCCLQLHMDTIKGRQIEITTNFSRFQNPAALHTQYMSCIFVFLGSFYQAFIIIQKTETVAFFPLFFPYHGLINICKCTLFTQSISVPDCSFGYQSCTLLQFQTFPLRCQPCAQNLTSERQNSIFLRPCSLSASMVPISENGSAI